MASTFAKEPLNGIGNKPRFSPSANNGDDCAKSALIECDVTESKPIFHTLSSTNDNSDVIESVARVLQRGGVVAIPTDTIYGVACLAQCSEAVEKLYAIKARSTLKPIAICVGESFDVCQWTRFPQPFVDLIAAKTGVRGDSGTYHRPCSPSVLNQLLSDFLPGPVTIVTERSPSLNQDLNPKTSLVGVRVPDHRFVRDLANRLHEPLALTSANISGSESSLSVDDFRQLWPALDAVVDGGEVGGALVDKSLMYTRDGSTVFQIMRDGKSFKVLRAGCAYEATVQRMQSWGLTLVL